MTLHQANLLWIRAHVLLHARNPDSCAWREEDLIAAFYALPAGSVTPFELWAASARIALDDDAGDPPPPDDVAPDTPTNPQTLREQLAATFGAAVPLYDTRTKGPLKWP